MPDNKQNQFNWNHAKAFLVTAEKGSLSAAADELGLTQPTLSRHIAALERSTGVALFEKGPKGFDLTPNGAKLVQHIKIMNDAADQFSLAVSSESESLEGLVTITSTEFISCYLLPDILKGLKAEQEGIQIEIISSDESRDLRQRQADIAIRAFRPTQPDLIAKKIGNEQFGFFASNAYVKQYGVPDASKDLSSHRFVGMDTTGRDLAIYQNAGLAIDRQQLSILSSNSMCFWSLVKAGLGIGVMHKRIAAEDNRVQQVFLGQSLPEMELWLVSHRELRTNNRIKYVFDYISKSLGNKG